MMILLSIMLGALLIIVISQQCMIYRLKEQNDNLELQLVSAHETAAGLLFELDECTDKRNIP
jgi:hypothetical protein